MKAVLYHDFQAVPTVADVPDPHPAPDGAVIEVRATGICRSDWHGWQGHDADIRQLPHVPGHEFAGVVINVGANVRRWKAKDRVTMPFVAGCGRCPECKDGHPQTCDVQFQPGFTAWGSFAERVAIRYADHNLVRLPDALDFVTAASLGCRMATAYRALTAQGDVKPNDWVAIHGCGGVGLSAVAIAAALGARPIAVDIRSPPLQLAADLGAVATLNATNTPDIPAAIRALTGRGADLSLDALGSQATAANSILSLRKRGRHVQVGLLAGNDANPRLPFGPVVANELVIAGSHGLAARDYPKLLELVISDRVSAAKLVTRTLALSEAPEALVQLESFCETGVAVIDRF